MKVMTILGTRPEIIRLSRIIPLLDQHCHHILVNTMQNYDSLLNSIFFRELGLREPDHFVDPGMNIGGILTGVELVLHNEGNINGYRPDRILILGDTNSGLSAIVAKRQGIPVYHMEAGNRCYDDRVPEEINRRIIDHCSDVLMPYTEHNRHNLLREGIAGQNIYVTGNPIYEVLEYYKQQIKASTVLSKLGLTRGKYFLVTAHRQENVEVRERLANIITACTLLTEEYSIPVVFSRYPNTARLMEKWDMGSDVILFHEPFGFFDFVTLGKNALCIITDSGTVQEECSILGTTNVTIRDVTERPETIECGGNMLVGVNPDDILAGVKTQLAQKTPWQPPAGYLDKNVSAKVLRIVLGYRG